jgi:branched-subunit amino acid aminotransferase/4-amino-4-deoxychorismate lyase
MESGITRIIFFNGSFVKASSAKISALAPGFLCGLGVFETMRSYQGRIIYLEAHLERLKQGCRVMGIEFDYTLLELKRIIRKVVNVNNLSDAYVRLTLSRAVQGSDILVLAKKYLPYSLGRYRRGFSLEVSSLFQNEDNFLSRMKLTNRAIYELVYQQARRQGFDDALILTSRGYISETSRSNIFLVKEKTLFTPSLDCGCLPGITRRVIRDLAARYGIPVYETRLSLKDLREAPGAFLTNSLIGVMPLKDKCDSLSEFFRKKYHCLLRPRKLS